MSKITCTRRLQFCAGHRVLGHESKCSNCHGHNYVIFIQAEADALDVQGRVIDFSVLKEKIGGWVDEHWDHGFIAFEKDEVVLSALQHIPGQKIFVLPLNPTAENMAMFLLETVSPLVLDNLGVRVTKVTIWETENCLAEAALN